MRTFAVGVNGRTVNMSKKLDDLIRIEDAIKVLCRKTCHPGALCPDSYCVEMWDEFKDVERVDAVPVRHGRWFIGDDGALHCSECSKIPISRIIVHGIQIFDMTPVKEMMKYCPNCDARMDGRTVTTMADKELFGISEQLDTISRQAAIDALAEWHDVAITNRLNNLPSAQPNLSEAYSKAVFTWLMDYQIRAAELKGRYTPYEVLSWVINDWRKENG